MNLSRTCCKLRQHSCNFLRHIYEAVADAERTIRTLHKKLVKVGKHDFSERQFPISEVEAENISNVRNSDIAQEVLGNKVTGNASGTAVIYSSGGDSVADHHRGIHHQGNGYITDHTPCTEPIMGELPTTSDLIMGAPLSAESSAAVIVDGAYKSYGSGKSRIPVLINLDMTVNKGVIYGLLGPSGCGKTTLLRCIIGRLRVDSGHVVTLGEAPGSVDHQVPGCKVGYMPQELALYPEFTIEETLNYFGRLHRMTRQAVKDRTEFLLHFLDLPEKTRRINQLSGGQQRRTSFAIALLQEPELLILDEPTVGVDPVLRTRIWNHLITIAQNTNTTIIITTHYIEEARQAHMVGLMRNGRLLAEAAPKDLLQKHQLQSLEDVFLHLCIKDGDPDEAALVETRQSAKSRVYAVEPGSADERVPLLSENSVAEARHLQSHQQTLLHEKHSLGQLCCWYMPSPWTMFALFIKNVINLTRNIGFLVFQFMLPAIQIILFCVCIGREPFGLRIAVVNNETSSPLGIMASSMYLQHLDNHTIIQENFTDMSEALDQVSNGHAWGVINMGENFTVDLNKRFINKGPLDNETLSGSSIHVWLDMTNQQISITLQTSILTAFESFSTDLLSQLGMNPALAQVPVIYEHPLYGKLKPSFTNFMAPGIILSITFFMATGLTALAFVIERKEGLLDRSMVAGVYPVEVMIAHICTQFFVMAIQVLLLLVFALAVFKVSAEGPLIWVIILTLFQGFVGMALGLVISAVCVDENSAIQAALGSVYPNMLLSGIIWPLESMPIWLRYVSYCLPMTWAAEAMRSILARGWGIEYIQVWRGFLMSIGWGWGFLLLAGIILKVKS